jgi:hypothetical protein
MVIGLHLIPSEASIHGNLLVHAAAFKETQVVMFSSCLDSLAVGKKLMHSLMKRQTKRNVWVSWVT